MCIRDRVSTQSTGEGPIHKSIKMAEETSSSSSKDFPFSNGDIVCLCSWSNKPNVRKTNEGWNLGVTPQGILQHNCGRGKRALWKVVTHPDGKVSFRTAVGDGKKNAAGTDVGWHLGIKEDGTVIPNAGLGPFARFTPIPVTVEAVEQKSSEDMDEDDGPAKPAVAKTKYCFLCQAHEAKPNRAGTKGWHLGVTQKGEIINNAGRGEAGQFEVIGMQSKDVLKEVAVPKIKGLGKSNIDKPFQSFDPTKKYYLQRIPSRKVRAVVSISKKLKNKAHHWVVYAPTPPVELPCQKTLNCSLQLGPAKTAERVQGQVVVTTHPLFFLHIPTEQWPPLQHQGYIEYTIEAELYIRRLKEKGQDSTTDVAEPIALTADEAIVYSRATSLIDFQNAKFQKWLDDNSLHPAPLADGKKEHAIAFAHRVFLFVRNKFKYAYENEMDRRASSIIKAGATDCGGFSILFSAILRPHGIPTRLLFGRWAASKKGTYCQVHVKVEFFVAGVGWIPVDLSSSVLHDKTPLHLKYFGKDPGDFVVFHVEHDIVLDTVYYGRVVELCLQGITFWTSRDGRGDGPVENDYQVTPLNM
eukprot:TRINITY_DN1308_c0_g1_i1.p1 TRINITY_DN1308_c0_g1~~TRINITY_DN1308_c0_g1_i1.p1  ORF type:complete len:581 (-),score=123.84 TRINITY_DN1308_c0_g1_i1:140-1882(-)